MLIRIALGSCHDKHVVAIHKHNRKQNTHQQKKKKKKKKKKKGQDGKRSGHFGKIIYLSSLLLNVERNTCMHIYPLSCFSFQPVLHDWCNKGRGMCYPVCGMVHIKEPLLLIDKSSLCGGSGFPFSLSEWSLTICLTPYNRR